MTYIDMQTLLSLVSFAGMVIMTVAYFKTQSKNGTVQANKELNSTTQEVIITYKTQVEQYKDQLEKYRQDMKEMTAKVGHLEGTLNEKDKQVKEFKDLLLGRSPEMEAFYKKAIPVLDMVEKYIQANQLK